MPGFWTNVQQAQERLSRSWVCYEGKPIYISSVEPDGNTMVTKHPLGDRRLSPLALDDKGWQNFRVLPPLGWHNTIKKTRVFDQEGETIEFSGPMFIYRAAARTRTHGLSPGTNTWAKSFSDDMTSLVSFADRNVHLAFSDTSFDFPDKYPHFQDVWDVLPEKTACALSEKFCVMRDTDGLMWLFRKENKCALVPNRSSIFLLHKFFYFREELEECKDFLGIETVKEI